MRKLLGTSLNFPAAYVRAPRDQRLLFLAGLLDSDGNLDGQRFHFTQKRYDWARDVWWMARSLGFGASIRLRKSGIKRLDGYTFSGEYWRVSISGDLSLIPTIIERKRATVHTRLRHWNPLTNGFDIQPIGTGDAHEIEVDTDGNFLLGDFTIIKSALPPWS